MKKYILGLIATIVLVGMSFGQKNDKSLDLLISKNEEIMTMIFKNHSVSEINIVLEKYNNSDDIAKEKLFKDFLGKDLNSFLQKTNEMKYLYEGLNIEKYNKENIEKYLSSINYESPSYGLDSLSSNLKPNRRAYNLCCMGVMGGSLIAFSGCTALTSGFGFGICYFGTVLSQTAGIGLCAEQYLH